MNKREYPLFMIDRTKSASYPFDYVTCTDRTVGFVARIVFFPADVQYFEFIKTASNIETSEFFNVTFKMKEGGIILVCEDFLYSFDLNNENKKRVQTLLKKALKKYLHAENDRLSDEDGFGIESQMFTTSKLFEMVVEQRNWYKSAGIDRLLAAKTKQNFKAGLLSESKQTEILLKLDYSIKSPQIWNNTLLKKII